MLSRQRIEKQDINDPTLILAIEVTKYILDLLILTELDIFPDK